MKKKFIPLTHSHDDRVLLWLLGFSEWWKWLRTSPSQLFDIVCP